MRKLYLLVIFIFSGITLNAQNSFEGIIEYEIVYSNYDAQYESAIAMQPTYTLIEYKDGISRTTMPNTAGKTIILTQNSTGKVITLLDLMGMKYGVRSTFDIENTETPKIQYTEGKKDILGYICKKAILEEDDISYEVYYTEEIKTFSDANFGFQIPGTPLEVKAINKFYTVIHKATNIEEKNLEPIRMIIPSDYEEKTEEELRKELGGM